MYTFYNIALLSSFILPYELNNFQYAMLTLFSVTWFVAMGTMLQPTKDEKKERIEELQDAIPLSNNLISIKQYNILGIYSLIVNTTAILFMFYTIFMMFIELYPENISVFIHDKISNLWQYIISNYDKKQLFVNTIYGIHLSIFLSGSIIHGILDYIKPNFIKIYKIQEEESIPLKYWIKGLFLVTFNEFVAYNLVNYTYDIYIYLSPNGFDEALPNIFTIILQMFSFAIISEIYFYYTHMIMHKSDFLWNTVHHVHHEITAPSVFFALYTHPIEYVFGNYPTLALGPLIFGSHFIVWVMWVTITTIDFCNGHSGWHLPFSLSAEFHDYHHKHVGGGNYGTGLAVFDTIYKTNITFLESINSKLNKFYTNQYYGVDKVLLRNKKY